MGKAMGEQVTWKNNKRRRAKINTGKGNGVNSRISNIRNICKGKEIVNFEKMERSRFKSTKPIVFVETRLLCCA